MRICPTCGACTEDAFELCGYDGGLLETAFHGPRVVANRYLLEQRIAAGAMGVVFRATHLQIGSTVAVKLMQPRKDELTVGLARFHREAQILGQIKHPNAVLVMDFGVEERASGAIPYLVTEFLRGESLATLLERKPVLTLDEAERIVGPLCEAVEEAHQVGVIHRDIKPSNIFIEKLRDGSEVVKVLDFGIAKFVEVTPDVLARLKRENAAWTQSYRESQLVDLMDEVAAVKSGESTVALRTSGALASHDPEARDWTITAVGFMVGTVPYMSPEQMTGERVSRQSDIYSIATLLYRLLTGRLPFDGEDGDVILKKLEDTRPSLRDAGANVPAALDALVRRCFALDPTLRPGSALELARALRLALAETRPDGVGDVARQLTIELRGLSAAVSRIQDGAREFARAANVEEGYQRVRDQILALRDPLARAGWLVEHLPHELAAESRQQLGDALPTLERELDPTTQLLHGLEIAHGEEYGEYLRAIWARVQRSLQLQLERQRSQVAAPGLVALPTAQENPFGDADAGGSERVELLARQLNAHDEIDASDAIAELLAQHVDVVFAFLAQGTLRTTPALEELVRGLWRHADTLLLIELYPQNRALRLLPLLTSLIRVEAAQPFAALSALFAGRCEGEVTAVGSVDRTLATMRSDFDRTVIGRCLLLHPLATVRERAAQQTELSDFWTVAIYPRTPIATLHSILFNLLPRAPAEYLKIFFLCVRDRLAAARYADDIDDAFRALQAFFTVPCFHEDVVFEPLLDLDRALRQRCREFELRPPTLAGYDEQVADFSASGAVESNKLEQMRDIPLPIQRKMAREGHFLTHFACHANERVARETLPHLLRLDDVTRFLRLPKIHRSVLVELARERRFFRKEAARLALLQNPKTPAAIARNFMPLVSHDQVRLLVANKHINAEVRTLARGFLDRLKQRSE